MPDDEKLEGQDEEEDSKSEDEEEDSKDKPKVVSLEDFNKLKSSLDGQISRERQARKRAEDESKTLMNKFSILEKSLMPHVDDEEDEEEDEEEDSLFGKKKKAKLSKSQKIAKRRMAALEEENTQLKEAREKSSAVQVIERRVSKLLTQTGVSRGDPELDWAQDVDDAEEGFDRLMASAIAIAEKRKGIRADAKSKVALKKQQPIEKGGPEGAASSFLKKWAAGEATPQEIEKVLAKGRRRTKEGGSELDIRELAS